MTPAFHWFESSYPSQVKNATDPLAQLAEHLTFNQRVWRSNRQRVTIENEKRSMPLFLCVRKDDSTFDVLTKKTGNRPFLVLYVFDDFYIYLVFARVVIEGDLCEIVDVVA